MVFVVVAVYVFVVAVIVFVVVVVISVDVAVVIVVFVCCLRYHYCLLSSLFILFYNQYCGEGTLEEASRGGQLPELMIRRYSRDTLLGISYLHENGIAHRDIKVGTGFTKYSFGESVFRNCLVFAKSKFIFSTTNV